jgi:methylmalonyl-CoA/ethylmalonyl-CoA epimerase
MVIDHIGIVVRSLDDGMNQWALLFGYRRNSDIVTNSRQGIRTVFLWKKDSLVVKLLEPLDESSPVFRFARKGGGLHHLCFRCDDMDTAVAELKNKGARFIVPAERGAAVGNQIAVFLTYNNLAVELIDSAEKTGWLGEG